MAETNSDHDDNIDDIKEVRGNKVCLKKMKKNSLICWKKRF